MTTATPSALIAGATEPHGEHEPPGQSWDRIARIAHGYDPGADTWGRHAAPCDDQTRRDQETTR